MLTPTEFQALNAEHKAYHRHRAYLVVDQYGSVGIRSGAGIALTGLSATLHETAVPVAFINPFDDNEVDRFIRFMRPDLDVTLYADLPAPVERVAARLLQWIAQRSPQPPDPNLPADVAPEPDRHLGLVKVDATEIAWTCADLRSATCWTDGQTWLTWADLNHPMRDPQPWELQP